MTKDELLELADRCEREEASRTLDLAIARAVLPGYHGSKYDPNLTRYSNSLDAHVRPERDDVFWRSGHDGEGPDPSLFKAQVLLSDQGRSFTGLARTEAMARRAAELRARASLTEKE